MKPHPLLAQHYRASDEKPKFVNELFNRGAVHYDPVVKWGFFGSGDFYRGWAQRRHGLRKGMRLLDVACGTGLMAVAAARVLGSAESITCVDPSEGMLSVARSKLNAQFIQSGGESMPVESDHYDFLTLGYALRHFGDLEVAFREFHRVLRRGGKVLILEVTKPSSRLGAWLFRVYFRNIYPAFTRLFTRSREAEKMMLYFWETMDACVPPEAVLSALSAAGFRRVHRTRLLGLFSEYVAVK